MTFKTFEELEREKKNPLPGLWYPILTISLTLLIFGLVWIAQAHASDNWLITSYCACSKCCGKTDGITASGKHVKYGYVAANWLPFGTKVRIEGLGIFEVQDRGAKSLFGSKKNHIKHLDVYMPTHKQARQFGVKYLKVEVIK